MRASLYIVALAVTGALVGKENTREGSKGQNINTLEVDISNLIFRNIFPVLNSPVSE